MEKHTENVIETLQEFINKPTQDETLALQTKLCSQTASFCIQLSGDWLYQGSPLPTKFAKLFASILHCIDGGYFLITPVEKVRLEVEDAPLVIVDFFKDETATGLILRTSIGTEHHIADYNRLKLTDFGIYLPLERGLWGKLSRACYYNFVNEFNLSDVEGLGA
ncbi:DUF1285 domain-containing protein [Shewanella sp.]|uniref:DUF1285 domain-containing protein n=1 Tax=Shewanella sp. TaxID=50422 RepID=UPI003A85C7EF